MKQNIVGLFLGGKGVSRRQFKNAKHFNWRPTFPECGRRAVAGGVGRIAAVRRVEAFYALLSTMVFPLS